MFGAAVRDRVIGRTPCDGIRLPELPHAEHFIPSPGQVHALAAALPDRFRATVYVAAGCGLRLGEVLGLEGDHVDFLRRELRVVQQCNSLSSGAVFISAPKTRTSVRTVELPSVVADALAGHPARASAVNVLDRTDPRNERTRAAELIFRNSAGRPQHRGSWARFWSQAARSVGLPAGAGFHTLRHYYATLLIESGASVKTVQLALGHASPSTTLDVYAGVWPDQLDRTRNLVDAALSRGQEVVAR